MYRETISDNTIIETIKTRQAQKYIMKTSSLFAAIVEDVEDAIICKDKNGIIIVWNKAAEKLYGYSASEMVGKSITDIIPQNKIEIVQEIFEQESNGKGKISYQAKAINKNGEEIEILLTTFPLKDVNGKMLGTSTITKEIIRKKKNEKRTEDFINIASHELKTPITSIKAYAQILERKFKKNGDLESANYISKLDSQINKLTYLIRDLIDINKIQNEGLIIKKEIFDIENLIDELASEITLLTPDIKISRKGIAKKKIKADKVQIGQVIINLIANAIKFSSVSNKLIIHVKQTKRETVVGIQDFGEGIEVGHQKRIFERFYRISREHNAEFPGLGVGLYISSEIIKSHNGKMWVISNKNEGSIFYFSLPL